MKSRILYHQIINATRKSITIIFLFLFTILTVHAQKLAWASAGYSKYTLSYNSYNQKPLYADAKNNTYFISDFIDSTYIGKNTLITDSIHHSSSSFIASYSAKGSLKWSLSFQGSYQFLAGAPDNASNFYVSGVSYSYSPMYIGSTLLYYNNSFLLKIDSMGHILWVKNFDSATFNNIGVSSNGSLVLSGNFDGSYLQIGRILVKGKSPGRNGWGNHFIASADTSGNINNARTYSNSPYSVLYYSYPFHFDEDGNIYIQIVPSWSSSFDRYDSLIIDSQVYNGKALALVPSIILKFNKNLHLSWQRSIPNPYSSDIDVDEAGKTYLFCYATLQNVTSGMSSDTNYHNFLAEYDSSGKYLSADSIFKNISLGSPNFFFYDIYLLHGGHLEMLTRNDTAKKNTVIYTISEYDHWGNLHWKDTIFIINRNFNNSINDDFPLLTMNASGNLFFANYFDNLTSFTIDTNITSQNPNNFIVGMITDSDRVTEIRKTIKNNLALSLFPNPTDNSFSISGDLGNRYTIEIYNISAKLIETITKPGGDNKVLLNRDLYPSGVYIVKILVDGSGFSISKLILR